MKRSTPLKRKTPMRRGIYPGGCPRRPGDTSYVGTSKPTAAQLAAFQKAKKTSLRPVSPKRQAQNVAYRAAVKQWRAGHDGRCEMRLVDNEPRPRDSSVPRCIRRGTENHHMKGRGRFLCDPSTFCALCPEHHRFVDTNRRQAVTLGYFTYVYEKH